MVLDHAPFSRLDEADDAKLSPVMDRQNSPAKTSSPDNLGAGPSTCVGRQQAASEPLPFAQVGSMMHRFVLILLVVLPAVSSLATDARETALLEQVAKEWFDERDRWAFTQFVREFDGKTVKQERLERYDPSRGYARRWELISIDGQRPTEQQLQEWTRRKNKKPRRDRPPIMDRFDFANAKVVEETPEVVRYELPLRSTIEWFFPISKVELVITINRSGPAPALEQVQAQISEPFRVALGLARVLNIDLDVQMEPPPSTDPADAKPTGTAQAVVTKFGDRVEYFWSEFKRVTSPPESEDEARTVPPTPLFE